MAAAPSTSAAGAATRAFRAPGQPRPHALAARLARAHGESLRATARRFSLDADDAQDAYQRGVEILLARGGPALERDALPWLRTVIKHEALAIRRRRGRALLAAGDDPVLARASTPGADEHALARERVRALARALARLKPQERRALLMRGEGRSYREIQAATGWSYTKVDRCLKEGRARLRALAAAEGGDA